MNPAVHITQQDILYEDRWLLALNKHAGWYTTPTVGDTENNIRVALTRFLQQRTDGEITLHLAHQLDRDTSGILLCSLNREVNAPLQEAFTSGSIEKTYIGGLCRRTVRRCLCAADRPRTETRRMVHLSAGTGGDDIAQ